MKKRVLSLAVTFVLAAVLGMGIAVFSPQPAQADWNACTPYTPYYWNSGEPCYTGVKIYICYGVRWHYHEEIFWTPCDCEYAFCARNTKINFEEPPVPEP